MLSSKLDSGIWTELEDRIRAAALISADARDVQRAAAAAPSDSQLAQKAAELTKKFTKVDAAAQRASTILANFSGRPVVTNAAHIFPESTNTNLDNDTNVECSEEVQIVFLIPHFLRLPESLCF
jgi:hypothetical protein